MFSLLLVLAALAVMVTFMTTASHAQIVIVPQQDDFNSMRNRIIERLINKAIEDGAARQREQSCADP